MAVDKLTGKIDVRIKESTNLYFESLNKVSKRKVNDYVRAILETMEEKGITLETLSALPDKPHKVS